MEDSETSTLQVQLRTVGLCLSSVIETRKQSLSFVNLVRQPGSLSYPISRSLGMGRRGPMPGDKLFLSVCMKDFF